jgi:hypothetical protein
LGVRSDATDGWDEHYEWPVLQFNGGFAGVFHAQNPPDWEGETAYYLNDYRSPLKPEDAMTWQPLHVWAIMDFPDDEMYLSFEGSVDVPPPTSRRYFLELLYVPSDVEGAPPVGSRWELPTTGLWTLELPTYRAESGKRAYQFALTATAEVPEPGTLVLLSVALLGWRHRRRGS